MGIEKQTCVFVLHPPSTYSCLAWSLCDVLSEHIHLRHTDPTLLLVGSICH